MMSAQLASLSSGYGQLSLKRAESVDDVATATPRSQSKSDDTLPLTQCTGSGSSFGSLSGSTLGSEDVLDRSQQNTPDNCKENEDYDSFLRDMAGSFEAVYDDEDDEAESESASGGETNEKSQEDSYDAFLREMAGSFANDDEDDDDDDDDDEAGSSDDDSDDENNKRSEEKVCTTRSEESPGRTRLAPSPTTQYRQSPLWKGSHTVRNANGELQSMDNRAPVLDSYDMVAATAPFEPPSLELPDTLEMHRENLAASIESQKKQVSALLNQSKKTHVDESCRSHYGRVGLEMLRELKSLEQQLAQLGN